MLRGRLGRRLARAGKQAGRTVSPGIAAALGTLAIPNPSHAAAAIDASTPSTAIPLTVPTTEIDVPALIGNQFYAFEIPAGTANVGIDVVLSGIDPDLHAYLLLTAGGQLTRQVAVPLITVGPGSSTISGSTTIMQPTGATTLSGGGGGGPATVMGGAGTFTLAGGPDLSFADLFINQSGGNFTVQGGGPSTISAGGGNSTVFGGGGNATISAGGGNSTVFGGGGNATISAGGGNSTVFGGGGNATISAGGGNSTVFGGGGNATISAGGGNSTVFGGGNATIFAGGGNPTISAGGGNPTISAGGGIPTLFAGGGTSPTVSGSPPQIPATILSGVNLSAFFDGDLPGDDVIVGIELENSGANVNGGVITFSQTVDPPAPVPEPGTLGLLASALAGLALRRRRRL